MTRVRTNTKRDNAERTVKMLGKKKRIGKSRATQRERAPAGVT